MLKGIDKAIIWVCIVLCSVSCSSEFIPSWTATDTKNPATKTSAPDTAKTSAADEITITPVTFPSATLAASQTWMPTATATPYPFPEIEETNSILVPPPDPSKEYQLKDWTPEAADELISVLEGYPETLSSLEVGYLYSRYFDSFRYAALVQAEAYSRFPDAPQATQWIWDSAYNHLQSYHTDYNDVGNLYSELIMAALNNGETNIAELSSWIEEQDRHIQVELMPIQQSAGYEDCYILFIGSRDADFEGGIYLWLLERRGDFTAYALISPVDIYLGDGQVSMELVDVTGDLYPEVIIQRIDWGSFNWHSGSLEIFDLSQTPPKKLTFDLPNYEMEIANWSVIEESDNAVGISMQIPFWIETMGCGNFGPTWNYLWNGTEFVLSEIVLPDLDEMQADPRCADTLINSLLFYAKRNNPFAISTIANALPHYPFSEPGQITDPDFSILAADELRFQLGLILARMGNVEGSREQMQAITSEFSETSSLWVQPAHQFLSKFQAPNDLLEACLSAGKCHSIFGIDKLIELIPVDQYDNVIALLEQMGVRTIISGSYDFDMDGSSEYWLIDYLWPDQTYNDLWIITRNTGGIAGRKVTWVNLEGGITQVRIVPLQAIGNSSVYQVVVGCEETVQQSFTYWQVEPKTKYEVEDQMDNILWSLAFGNMEPETAIQQLTEIKNSPVDCINTAVVDCIDHASIEYAVGLAYELAGEAGFSTRVYIDLWQNYPESPYAIIAMHKLEPIP